MEADKDILVVDFVKQHAVACGGDWSAMLMSAIKSGLPEVFQKMEDRSWSFVELFEVIKQHV
jgi:hypothetical protein